MCPQYFCEVGSQPRCNDDDRSLLPLVTTQFCPQLVRGVWTQVRPRCADNRLVLMWRLDRGLTCKEPSGAIHRPGGQPPGVRRMCREGDQLCEEFRNKCFWMVNGCGLMGGWRNALLKTLKREKNNRIVVNDMKEYVKQRRQRQGLD